MPASQPPSLPASGVRAASALTARASRTTAELSPSTRVDRAEGARSRRCNPRQIVGAAALSLLFAGTALGQAIGERTHFTFHVYADSSMGSDEHAGGLSGHALQNPRGGTSPTASPLALGRHPYTDPLSGTKPTEGFLQQAPYSFRTVAAALQYVTTQFPSLPWTYPGTDAPTRRITHIVIHVAPGLYGPGVDQLDPDVGLRYNGEVFPLWIPDRVSIQGAGALDTIFDARQSATHIFHVQPGTMGPVESVTHEDSFIDGVTMRGARSGDDETSGFPHGAGVYIGREGNVRCTISNCFITDNHVGIAIHNDEDVERYRHSPIIVNNTIAWNMIGIWSGNDDPTQPDIGFAIPRVFNNILDSGDPYARFGPLPNSASTAPFWGLDPSDMRLKWQALGAFQNFNAFEKGRADAVNVYQSTFTPPPFWRSTRPRSVDAGNPSPSYLPAVDIGPWTKAGTMTARGSLYVNDIFRNSSAGSFDRSPHDFRLAPLVAQDTLEPLASDPQGRNPLVNRGVDLQYSSRLEFMNRGSDTTLDITRAPGLLSPGPQSQGYVADYARFDSWDWDAEGFGNRRSARRPGYPFNSISDIDIGADEMDVLIMAGYIDRTRIFSWNVPAGDGGPLVGGTLLPIASHQEYFYFDLPGTHNRPVYVHQVGGYNIDWSVYYMWWDYVQSSTNITPLPGADGNYTFGIPGSTRWLLNLHPSTKFEPFPRNLVCDYSPHLLPDFHPLWASVPVFDVLPLNDIFACNSWFGHDPAAGHYREPAPHRFDNRLLYYDATRCALLEGTMNPAGSWIWTPGWGYLFLGSSSPLPVFGPWRYTGPSTYTIPSSGTPTRSWGMTHLAPDPDYVPAGGGLGVRYNCQSAAGLGTESNLQSFLTVGLAALPPAGSPVPRQLLTPPVPAPRGPTAGELLEAVQVEMLRRAAMQK